MRLTLACFLCRSVALLLLPLVLWGACPLLVLAEDPASAAGASPDTAAPSSAGSNDSLQPNFRVGLATDVAPPSVSPAGTPPASAPSDPLPDASAPATPSQNVTINLINLMVKRGLISKEDAAGLIKQAEQEAEAAKAQAAATPAVSVPGPPSAPASSAAASEDEVSVSYVPDVVRQQITDQVEQDVLKQTRSEQFAPSNSSPDWVKAFHVTSDIRVRYEDMFFPSGNAVGSFPNFNSINTGSGVNVNPGAANYLVGPQYDVDQDRERFRLRARLGAEMDLGDGFSMGLRVATGSDDNPVTENQTLGANNSGGQGGYFGKYQIWLDRAFLRYEVGGQPDKDLSVTIGRFDDPFFHTSMIWADDLAFDGIVVKGKYQMGPGVTPFFAAGAFPVFNTDLNFSTNQAAKFNSEDRYLFGAQAGTTWKINQDFTAKGAVAGYYYLNIEGKESDPINDAAVGVGNTDDSRPSFAQNGNTYVALRDFQDPAPGSTPEDQYFGLATPFHELALTGQLDFSRFDPFHMSLMGEYVNNLAFDRNDIMNSGAPFLGAAGPVNNLDGTNYVGGNMGWLVRLNLGKPALEQLWDWNVGISYRYVESDATVDAFTDADFGGNLTGTNLKGYTLDGNLALSSRVWLDLKWMSADAVAGPTYENDLIQFDVNAKF